MPSGAFPASFAGFSAASAFRIVMKNKSLNRGVRGKQPQRAPEDKTPKIIHDLWPPCTGVNLVLTASFSGKSSS